MVVFDGLLVFAFYCCVAWLICFVFCLGGLLVLYCMLYLRVDECSGLLISLGWGLLVFSLLLWWWWCFGLVGAILVVVFAGLVFGCCGFDFNSVVTFIS